METLDGALQRHMGGSLGPCDAAEAGETPNEEGLKRSSKGPHTAQQLTVPNVSFAAVEIPGRASKP